MAKDTYELDIDTRRALQSLRSLRGSLGALPTIIGGAFTVAAVVNFGQEVVRATKTFQSLQNSLRLVTIGTEELNEITATLRQTAINNRTSFEETADLYVRLKVATEELGISSERVVAVTTKLSQALQVAGADAATTNAVIRQFGQAMASGEVRGDEFRSIVEGLGPALAIMARESGLTVGELRRMSQEGELTAETMFKIFEQSNALTAAFNQMQPTLSQLETALGDAFDAFLVKIGEASGATNLYEGVLKSLTRTLNDIADVGLTELTVTEVFDKAKQGAITLDSALYELKERLDDADSIWAGLFDNDLSDNEVTQIQSLISKLEDLKAAQQEVAQSAEETARAQRDQQQAVNDLLEPYRDAIIQAKKFANEDYRTNLEKANDRIKTAKEVIEQLSQAYQATNGEMENFSKLMKAAQDELKSAQAEFTKLKEKQDEVTLTGFAKYYKELVDNSKEAAQILEFEQQALQKLKEDLNAGTISQEAYAEATRRIRQETLELNETLNSATSSIIDFNNSLSEQTSDLKKDLRQLNMDPLDRQLSDISHKLGNDLTKQVIALKELKLLDPENAAEYEKLIQQATSATNKAIQEQRNLAKEIYDTQRSYTYGWKEAFREYEDAATNAARNAERIFQKTTQGMEDMIVNFVKTGKFEFKSFAADILETLLRSQIQQTIASVFKMPGLGGSSVGGGLGSLFAGFFGTGGLIPAGKFGIAGESGPELITGPATVTPLTGGGNVTYNIQAVDAASFKSLVARDPGFIHAVAQQGSRKIPSRR